MLPEDLSRRAKVRAETYKLLAECYHPPGEELADRLKGLGGSAGGPLAVLAGATFTLETLEAHKVDHSKLFVGPFTLLAAPYGSVYLETGGKLAGESTVDASRRYGAEGLDLALREMPDHVAIELEFMHFLVCKEGEAIERSEPEAAAAFAGKQRDFLEVHLGAWVAEFAARVREGAETEFYRKLAAVTEEFVRAEAERLAGEPEVAVSGAETSRNSGTSGQDKSV